MKQKIEWYREVLELEPGSRVFFPLAKLLAADGQLPEAIHALRQGVLRHPDHVEARLLLVELLFMEGAAQELSLEIDNIGGLFSAYPGFWEAWSDKLAVTPSLRDAALALRFFAAALQGAPLSWSGIIEQGLRHSLEQGGDRTFAPPRSTAQEISAMRRSARDAAEASASVVSSGAFQVVNPPTPRVTAQAAAQMAPEVAARVMPTPAVGFSGDDSVPQAAVTEPKETPPSPEVVEDEEPEEAFSLRTRSMAEVLAEQGDLVGALDIYHELMQQAKEEEKVSLQARADELSHRMQAGPSSDPARSEEKAVTPGAESSRLVDLLESLALRLEARAR